MAVALQWVSRITTVALEMVLPGLLGLWIDGKLGVPLVFTLLGFGLGGSFAMWHLLRMTRLPPDGQNSRSRGSRDSDRGHGDRGHGDRGHGDRGHGDRHSSEDGK